MVFWVVRLEGGGGSTEGEGGDRESERRIFHACGVRHPEHAENGPLELRCVALQDHPLSSFERNPKFERLTMTMHRSMHSHRTLSTVLSTEERSVKRQYGIPHVNPPSPAVLYRIVMLSNAD